MIDRQPEFGFDLAAASLRADEPEVQRAIGVFAGKLESALPFACRVKRRRRSLLSRESRVTSVEVGLGEVFFHLSQTRQGVVAVRTEHVHDMHRRTETLSVADWLDSLERALRERAASSSEAREALEQLIEG
jgi:hypothetical protein